MPGSLRLIGPSTRFIARLTSSSIYMAINALCSLFCTVDNILDLP